MILNIPVIYNPFLSTALSVLAVFVIIRVIRWILDILP